MNMAIGGGPDSVSSAAEMNVNGSDDGNVMARMGKKQQMIVSFSCPACIG